MYEYYIEYLFTERTCTFLFYIQSICLCECSFAFVTFTINRFFAIVYHTEQFFKTKKFMFICIANQWIVGGLVSLPFTFYVNSYCGVPQWLLVYTVIIAIIIPVLFTLSLNVAIYKYVHSSSLRIHPQMTTTAGGVIIRPKPTINRRDLYLLKHTVFMFSMFIIGWTPIFSLVALDYSGNVSPLVYALLQVLSVISVFICMCDLFWCNQNLRRYIKNKICAF
ncbi:hypothetical protein I4U23_002962 [Adineta vaga]|nr:hypothetical protein I4U23_002962 [Adineta vaga]